MPNKYQIIALSLVAVALLLLLNVAFGADTNSPIFFVETQGGIQKLHAKDRLFAAVSAGTTVWTEDEWNEMTNGFPVGISWGSEVVDRTIRSDPGYVVKTNSDGVIFFESTRPPVTNILSFTNVYVLRIHNMTFPLWGMSGLEVARITNAFKDRVYLSPKIELRSDSSLSVEYPRNSPLE